MDLPLTPERLGDYPVYSQSFDLLNLLKEKKTFQTDVISAQLQLGDAKSILHDLIQKEQKFDVILQDPFSPKKNPECWDLAYFELLSKCCHKETMLMTYSVASDVRRNMEKVGFDVRKLPGFGGKREQLIAEFQ